MGKKWSEAGSAEKILRLYSLLLFSQKRWSLKPLTEKLNCSKSLVFEAHQSVGGRRLGQGAQGQGGL